MVLITLWYLGIVYIAILLLDDDFFRHLPEPKAPYLFFAHELLVEKFYTSIGYSLVTLSDPK